MSYDTTWDLMQQEKQGRENAGMSLSEALSKVKENGSKLAGLKVEIARLRGYGVSNDVPSFSANIDRAAGRITGEFIEAESNEPEQVATWDRKTGTIRRL